MASRKKSFIFLGAPERVSPVIPSDSFEFDESDVWSPSAAATEPAAKRSAIPAARKSTPAAKSTINSGVDRPSSLPVNVPDWSKILGSEYKDRRRYESDDDNDDNDDDDDVDCRVPPHEYLARTRVASFSVHEGIGRTLKGRDLSRVRNAIWKQTGFED